jgi:hypothetical protein
MRMLVTLEFADAGTKSGTNRVLVIGRDTENIKTGDIGLRLDEAKTLINCHKHRRRDAQSVSWKTARKGPAHVLDQARCSFAPEGPMRSAQLRAATTLSTMVPGRRDPPSRATVALATPPFLTVPNDSHSTFRGVLGGRFSD